MWEKEEGSERKKERERERERVRAQLVKKNLQQGLACLVYSKDASGGLGNIIFVYTCFQRLPTLRHVWTPEYISLAQTSSVHLPTMISCDIAFDNVRYLLQCSFSFQAVNK